MQKDDSKAWYAAFRAKDARFDGRFFVGISSTGIYCRPICRARLPKIENCTLYHTAAEAEQAGYRPCLLCRPELAPGMSRTDATPALVCRAARMLEENCGNRENLQELARRLGCTDRHLRRAFKAEYNVSPVEYLQTCRLLLAKNLLTDTRLSVLEVSMAAGFGSLRRFNELFKKRYHLSPTALRKRASVKNDRKNALALTLCYRPPYRWSEILDFLDERAIPGIDFVKNDAYFRTAHLVTAGGKQLYGWLQIKHKPQKNAISIHLSETLWPAAAQVLAQVRRLFDLDCDPDAIYEILSSMNDICPGLCVPGTRLPGSFDAFETAVRAILGQHASAKEANALAAKLTKAYGIPIETGIAGLTHIFPSPGDILALEEPIENKLKPLGITGMQANSILKLAQALMQNNLGLNAYSDPEAGVEKLLSIPDFDLRTAQYIVMRIMEWPDAFFETDVSMKKALAPHISKELLEIAETWRPWRSYAAMNIWNSIKQGGL